MIRQVRAVKSKDRSAEILLVSFAVIITLTVLVMGYFDSPEYNGYVLPSSHYGISETSLRAESGKTDINNATLEELMELEQIGEVRAQEIIDYREENGGFYSIEEILCIDKIPQSVYNKIKDKITVGIYTEER